MGGSGRRRVTLALLALLALLLTDAPARAAAAEPTFCESATLHDYLAPLRSLPKLRELPYRRKAEPRFHGVHIGASGPSLAVGGGSAGYQFGWGKNPGWDVTVTLARVSWNGKVVQRLGRRHVGFAALAPALITEPRFGLPAKPGVYRTTLVIRSSSGRRLAEFGNYFRVVMPTVQVSLAPDAASYRPGETLYARVENAGAAFVLFGYEYAVEPAGSESPEPVPEVSGPLSAPPTFVGPGAISGRCTVFPIPASMPPGRYRLSQEAVVLWPSQKHTLRPIVTAEFEVAGALAP